MASNSRNIKRRLFTNRSEKYRDIIQRKQINHLTQWATKALLRFSPAARNRIRETTHIWKTGDRYSKLAATHYGNSEYWWIIAHYNHAPTEGHLRLGDVILIPGPLEKLLEIL